MGRRTRVALTVAAIAGSVMTAAVIPSAAQEAPPPIAAELLTDRAAFTDNVDIKVKVSTGHGTEVVTTGDPSRTVTARFTVQPGARFPWHTHAGPVIVNVVQGTLVYVEANTARTVRIRPARRSSISVTVTCTRRTTRDRTRRFSSRRSSRRRRRGRC